MSASDRVYVGSYCHCYRRSQADGAQPERFVIVAHFNQKVIGQLVYHPEWQRYCLIPAPGTAWASRTLSEIGLWLRRLNQRPGESGSGGRQ